MAGNILFYLSVLAISLLCLANGFSIKNSRQFQFTITKSNPSYTSKSISKVSTNSYRSSVLHGATDGLDSETLNALGNLVDSDVVDAVATSSDQAVVVSIISKLAASPAILAVPIGAGFLVAFAVGFFIYSYGRGSD